jgi:hypothetical protein
MKTMKGMTISDGFSLGIGIMLAFAAAIAVVFVIVLLMTAFRKTGGYSLSADDYSSPANSYPYPPVRQQYQPNPVLPHYTWLEQ